MLSIETVLILGFVILVGALVISVDMALRLSIENERLKRKKDKDND